MSQRRVRWLLAAILFGGGVASAENTPQAESPDSSEPVAGILRPGETFTYRGVSVTWVAPPKAGEATDSVGFLSFRGPTGELPRVPIPARFHLSDDGRELVTDIELAESAYLDEVVFSDFRSHALSRFNNLPDDLKGYLRDQGQRPPRSVPGVVPSVFYEYGISLGAYPQRSRQSFKAGPERGRTLYVSSVTRLFLNNWELTLAEAPRMVEGKTEWYEIAARNTETEETARLPAVRGAMRSFGRFEVEVGSFSGATRTTGLSVRADVDPTVRGRGAYVEDLDLTGDHLGVLLEDLGESYGFSIEWVPYSSEYPESIEYIRNLVNPVDTRIDGIYLEEVVRFLGRRDGWKDAVSFEWTDDTHLRVRAANYDRVVSERKRKVREEQERKGFEDLFDSEYRLVTEVYRLEQMSALAARDIVARELRDFVLGPQDWQMPPETVCPVEKEGEFFAIIGCEQQASVLGTREEILPPDVLERAIKQARELVVADERSNSLLVTAIARTHERVKEVLAKMEGLLAERVAGAQAERHPIEVALLRGAEAGRAAEEGDFELSFRITGIVDEVTTEAGATVQPGDILARLETVDHELAVKTLEGQISGLKTKLSLVREQCDRAKRLFESGRAPSSELRAKEVELTSLETEIRTAELALQQERNRLDSCVLRAPVAGTVTAVRVRRNQKVEPGQTVVALLSEEEKKRRAERSSELLAAAKLPSGAEAQSLAERYGITPRDFELFGFATIEELGKGLVALAAERGETGSARLSLTETYGCELQFQDLREPYLIVRGRLLREGKESPILENTLYLEREKPSLLGVTNLREGLILVVRLRNEVEGGPSRP